MGTVVLLISKTLPVKLEGKNYKIVNPKYTTFGDLSTFEVEKYIYEETYTIKYSYTGNLKAYGKVRKGYCKVDVIDNFKNKRDNSEKEFTDKSNWFDDVFELAEVGDFFERTTIDFFDENNQEDYTNYYYLNRYIFRLNGVGTLYINNYRNPALYPEENTDIDSPDYSVRIHINKNLTHTTPAGRFYVKNFGSKVNTSNLSPIEKKEIAELMVSICLCMQHIIDEKLLDELLAIESPEFIAGAVLEQYGDLENSPDPNTYNQLELIDKFVAEVLRGWGHYYFIYTLSVFEPTDIFPDLDINAINKYKSAIFNFYSSLHLMDELVLFPYNSEGIPVNKYGVPLTIFPLLKDKVDSERRINLMISLLQSISLSLFLPEHRLLLLDRALNYKEIFEDRVQVIPTPALRLLNIDILDNPAYIIEDEVIKLVKSFNITYDEANMLMDFLLQTKNYDGSTPITKFERLYKLIDDKRLDNIAIINWLFDERNNRGKLILALFEIWQKSKYHFYSVPPGVPPNEDGTNPENYFLYTPEGNSYYAQYDEEGNVISGVEPILDFQKTDLGVLLPTIEIKYSVEKELNKEKVVVDKELNINPFYYDYLPVNQFSSPKHYGDFHLYQTITLTGYKSDEDLTNFAPYLQMSLIPSFLFYYVEEYDRLKNIDATISFVFEVGLEAGLFFATAGASAATSLRHVRHLSKLRHIKQVGTGYELVGVAANEAILVWRVAQGSAEIVAMTAGIAASYLNFLGTVQDDPFKRRLSYFFVAFALASVGGAIFSNKRVVNLADDIIQNTPPNLLNDLPTEVRGILDQVRGKHLQAVLDFNTKLGELANLGMPNINAFYNGLTPRLRTKFLEDFGKLKLTDINDWNRLSNNLNNKVLDNWKSLADMNIGESRVIDIITNQNIVNSFIDFYTPNSLRTIIEPLDLNKKLALFENFKNISTTNLNKFINNPDLINNWFRYYDDAVLQLEFKLLGENGMIKFIERYGDISDNAFRNLKGRTAKVELRQKLDYLLDFPNATHNITYFNKRRAEMLPPAFLDLGKKKLYGIQEVDSFIELELLSGGKARASLANEAGDIIMEGGNLNGISLDPMGIAPDAISNWQYKFNKEFNAFKKSIDRHFMKIHTPPPGKPPLDKVVIDFKNMDEINPTLKQQVLDYIQNNHQQYDNDTYLIKLNL